MKKNFSRILKFLSNNKGNLLTVLLFLFILRSQWPVIQNSYQQTGKTIRPTSLKNLKGKTVELTFEDKKVFIFWATWCGPCHLQMKIIDNSILSDSVKREKIIAISLGENLHTVKKFLEKNPLPFKVLVDENQLSWKYFNVKATPSLAIVGKKGKIEYFTSGLSPLFPFRAWYSL